MSLQHLEVSGNGDIDGLSRFACIPAESRELLQDEPSPERGRTMKRIRFSEKQIIGILESCASRRLGARRRTRAASMGSPGQCSTSGMRSSAAWTSPMRGA